MIPIVCGGGQRSFEVTRGQSLKTFETQYLKKGSMDESHTRHVDCPYSLDDPYCFWWRSKVIWGQQRSKSENIVNTISQEEKVGWISYFACRLPIFIRWSLLFVVEVKGHLRSPEVRVWKHHKHDISRREAWMNLILGMWTAHIY